MNEFFVILLSLLFRILIGKWSHSGQATPPMFGDFEAQRHWLEITTNLKIGDWYRQTPDNDLLYWGLDYPPLTAYVSNWFGLLARFIHPEMVALFSSRGHESVVGKMFMRYSVILCDIVIFFPSVFLLAKYFLNKSSFTNGKYPSGDFKKLLLFFLLLNTPSLLLIDHGHFQYNGFSIGLSLLASVFIFQGHFFIASIFYCLSLNFKQMSLYYSLVFFCSLLRKCFEKDFKNGLILLVGLGIVVILSFTALWAPFCIYHAPEESCVSSLLHVLQRLFPFSRGIFEDKVANIWYALSVVYDYRFKISVSLLKQLSIALTLILSVPTCYHLLTRTLSPTRMIISLINGSLAFFLASFQVHEKSLLLTLVPAAFLVGSDPVLVLWIQLLGTWTMFPLLIKDGLRIPYVSIQCLWIILIAVFQHESSKKSFFNFGTWNNTLFFLRKIFFFCSVMGMIVLHVAELFVPCPQRYPDFYPALFSLFGALNLCVLFVYMNILLFSTEVDQELSKKDN